MLKQIIAPSVLNANFLELGNGLKAIENGGAGLVHLDIMDGHFVPNISFGPGISACVKEGHQAPARLPFDDRKSGKLRGRIC